MAKKNGENEHIAGILCYFLVGIIWYFADDKMKKSDFVRFHSKQALNLFIISAVLNAAAHLLFFIGAFIMFFVGILLFVLWLIGVIAALNEREKKLPIIGKFAAKYLTY